MVVKFKNDVYAVDEDGEVYLVDQKGVVLDKKALRKSKLVYGVGVNDWKFSIGSSEGGIAPAYNIWTNMLGRGYGEKCKAHNPTYEGVNVSKEWLTFSNFFRDMKDYIKQGWQLDKDLLLSGNKQYNKNSCIFVPQWLNLLLTDRGKARGDTPQGVCWRKARGRFQTICSVDGKQKHIGYFSNVEEASDAYINFKLNYIESKRLDIEAVARHNGLHARFDSDFNLTDRVIDNFKKQVS